MWISDLQEKVNKESNESIVKNRNRYFPNLDKHQDWEAQGDVVELKNYNGVMYAYHIYEQTSATSDCF